MKTKLILTFFISLLSYINLSAQATVTCVASGLWSNPLIWDAGVPASGDNVIIAATYTVNADAAATPINCNWMEIYGELIIDVGVTLTVSGDGSDGGNPTFGQNFTIDGASPGIVTNNGTLIFDPGATGNVPFYEDQAGGTFTNTGTFTIDNGGYHQENGAFTNSGTVNITNTNLSGNTRFDNSININNNPTPVGIFNVDDMSTLSNVTVAGLSGSFGAGNGTININAGGTYEHNVIAGVGTIPTCTWNSGANCDIIGVVGTTAPAGLGQSFANFTWNTTTQSGTVNLNGALTAVTGDFTVSNIQTSRTLALAAATSPTITIGGNLVIAVVGSDIFQFSTGAGSPVVNVGGNVTLSGGRLHLASSTGSPTLNVTGDFLHSSGTSSGLTMNSSSGASTINIDGNFTFSSVAATALLMSSGSSATGIGTINLEGNFNYSSATASLITETNSNAAGEGRIFFTKAGTQTFNSAVTTPFANTIELTVNVGSTLDMTLSATNLSLTGSSQFFTVNGTLTTGPRTITANASTTFLLAAGATLNTTNANGVSAAAAGTIQGTGTKTFDDAANYILGGASTTTGFTNNATMNNLTTTASAVLGQTIIVNGAFLNSAGTFTAGTNTVTVAGTFTNNGTIDANSSTINVTGIFTNSSTFNANTGTLKLAGNFSNGGTFNANTGTVVFNGAGAQTIGGASTTSFNNITQSNAAGVSLMQHANLIAVLTISTGTFDSNGFDFTLRSNSDGTASIAEITGTGGVGEPNFAGDIVMERYTGSSPIDWRFLCSPVSGALVSEWADDFATSGFTGATCGPADCASPGCAATCNYPSIYSYNEATLGDLELGYDPIDDVNDAIVNGLGYWVYLGPNPITFAVRGNPTKFDQSAVVSFNNSAPPDIDDDGWNLVANPYPCAIDWDDADWTKTSIDDAIYIYNASTGTYASYILGAETNGGTKNIASQQAFWVKANTDVPAPELTATEGVKTTTVSPTFLKTKRDPNTSYYPSTFKDFPVPLNVNNVANSIRLVASRNGYADEIIIRFRQGATNNFDGKYDAWKLLNPNVAAQNFSSVITGNKDLAINSFPELTADVNIPLRLTVPVTGTYKISRDSILMIPLSSCIVLEDKKTGGMIDLRTNVTYTFTISDTTVAPRFILHIYAPVTKKSFAVSCPGGNNGMAIATGIGTGPWNYEWKDSGGNIVKTTIGSSTSDTLFNCASGTYSVTVNGAVCGTVTDTVVVNSPAILSTTVSQTNIPCFGGGNTGSIVISPYGGTASYSYLWGGGQTTSAISNLSLGNYSVTVTDAHGCTATTSVAITQPAAITNTVSATTISCFGGNDGSATISTSGGTPSYSYVWDNGQSAATAINLMYGNYSVTVTDANGCTSTATVTVAQPVALTNTVSVTNISCFGENDGSAAISSSGGIPSYSFQWDNGETTSTIANLSVGYYSVTVVDANGCPSTTTISITEPAILTNTISATNASCYGGTDGSATVSPAGGTPSYSYSWNTGQTTASAINLSAGNYSLTVTDANGCTTTASVVVTEPAAITAAFTASTYTVDIFVNNTVSFTNTSSGTSSYEWDFGDGSGIDVSVNPAHAYTLVGTYTVMLISSDGICFDTAYATMVVIDSNPTGLSGSQFSSSVNVIYENGEVFLLFSFNKETQVNISVYNMIGEEVVTQDNLIVKNERIKLDIPNSSAGAYIAISEIADAIISKKIFIPSR